MEHIMVSEEDVAAMEVAIEVCNRPEIKKEILCTPGSDYDMHKGTYEYTSKKQWSEIVEKKSRVILENLSIAKEMHEKVTGIVLLAGMRMLTWAEYHEGTLGISREYSFNFLNKSLFAQLGIIDNKKAAEELMKDEKLNAKQKYKLACLYCFEDHIPVLYKQMTKEDKKEFYDAEVSECVNQPELVKFWSYYLMGEVDRLKEEKNLDQYRLETAVESGSVAAVEYCLDKTNSSSRNDSVVVAAVEAVRCRMREVPHHDKDWVVFRHQRYEDSEESWVPSDYYVDILCFLLSKMGEDQQMDFLKRDVEGNEYEKEFFGDQKRSRVLEYLLNWPYQDYFMKTAGAMWEFLPERDYAVLLLRICDKIKPRKEGSLKYGEERSYDYRELLRLFWHSSPEYYKRYVFSNQEVDCIIDKMFITTKVLVRMLTNLLTLKKFACKDQKNIQVILYSATEKEKENLMSSQEWRKVCFGLMEEDKWEILDRFSSTVFLTKEEEDKFKKELCFEKEAMKIYICLEKRDECNADKSFINWSSIPEEEIHTKENEGKFKELCFASKAKRICIEFIRNGKWNAAESFIKWSSLSEEGINKLKKEMIYSYNGFRACTYLISPENKLEALDQFIRWCFSSEEDIKAFKKELLFSGNGTVKCALLLKTDQQELVSEFIKFGLSTEECLSPEIIEFKKYIAYESGSLCCEDLISDRDFEDVYDDRGDDIGTSIKFKGGKWEQVEKFLTWCFSSEEEINEFKKNVLLKEAGTDIHFKLVESSQFEEAETFFAWLGLSSEEIQKLKKDTIHNFLFGELFSKLMYSEKGNTRFVDHGSREERIELLLRWYGTDKETLLEYQKDFKHEDRDDISSEDEDVVKDLDLMIEQRLNDLDEEQREVKPISETSSTQK